MTLKNANWRPGNEERGRERPPAVAGRRSLVVDDNLDSAESLALLLDFQGTRGEHRHGWPRGDRDRPLVPARGRPPGHRPAGVDGYEVARRMRAEPGLAGAVFIAMTCYGREEDMRRSMESGFDRHLVKPVDFDVLDALWREPHLS